MKGITSDGGQAGVSGQGRRRPRQPVPRARRVEVTLTGEEYAVIEAAARRAGGSGPQSVHRPGSAGRRERRPPWRPGVAPAGADRADARGRAGASYRHEHQLSLIIPGLPLRPARPIGLYRLRSDGRYHPPDWARRQRPAAVADDQRVCPSAMPGQLMLWRSSRSLTSRHAALIRDRHLDGYPEMEKELSAYAAGHGYTKGWVQQADAMIRLALAIRDADGDSMIHPAALADLPRYRDTVGEVARRAGLLNTLPPDDLPHRPRFGPAPRHSEPQGCLRCLNWGIGPVCRDCARWASGPEGTCPGCGRSGVRLRGSRCRTCADQAWSSGPEAAGGEWVQMSFHGSWSRRHRPAAHPEPRAASTGDEGGLSGHLLWPGQDCLAEARRDWRPAFGMARLPALTQAADALLADFEEQALSQQWTASMRASTTRAMRVLLSWLGVSAPIPEADVRALGSARAGVKVRRLLSFLAVRGLLKPAPDSHLHPMELAVARRIGQLPGPMAAELRRWVAVMRGQGRREHRAASFRTIYNYLGYALPVLGSWQQRVTSLREITRDDVLAAVSALRGEDAHHLMVALRSVFRALRQERMVFANPCAGISVTRSEALPTALPSDRLAGLIERAGSPLARLAVALVSVHAVQPGELRRLTMADLDLPRARITIRSDAGKADPLPR